MQKSHLYLISFWLIAVLLVLGTVIYARVAWAFVPSPAVVTTVMAIITLSGLALVVPIWFRSGCCHREI